MEQFRNIVVAVDFSECSKDAMAQASRLAALCAARLRVFHVIKATFIEDMSRATSRPPAELNEHAIAAALEDLKQIVPISGSVSPQIEVRVGSPAEDIVQYGRECEADLLVLGRSGTAGQPERIGTTAMACARRAASTVLVVPQGRRDPFDKIIVGVDFSETSQRAVAVAAGLAKLELAAVEVVHVFFGPWNLLHYRAPTLEVAPEFQQQYRRTIEAQLTDFAAKAASDCPEGRITATLVPDFSSAGYGLVKHVEESKPDLTVVGTHGRTGVRRLLMGSTAERVLHDASCAVMVVKPATPDIGALT
jgi:universal stress protein E